MSTPDGPTRRTVLTTAGAAVGVAALGSAGYATGDAAAQDGSGATVDWYNVYAQDDEIGSVWSVFVGDGRHVVLGDETIRELSPSGETEATHSLPRKFNDSAQTSDGGYFHAAHEQRRDGGPYGLVVKTGGEGGERWRWENEHTDDSDSALRAAVAGPDGGGYAFGNYGGSEGKLPFGVRFDADGTVRWERTWNPGNALKWGATHAVPATDGGAVLYDTGSAARVTPDGVVDWASDYGTWFLHDIVPDFDGGYVAAATEGGSGTDDSRAALLTLNESGRVVSVDEFTVPGEATSWDVSFVALTDAGVVVGGSQERMAGDDTTYRSWAAGLTRAGDARWYHEPGGQADSGMVTAFAGDGGTVLLGGEWDTTDGSEEGVFVARISEGDEGTATATPTDTATASPTASPTPTATESGPGTETPTRSPPADDTPTSPGDDTTSSPADPTPTETTAHAPDTTPHSDPGPSTPTPTATASGTPSETQTGTGGTVGTATDATGPGFGVAAALAGAAAAVRALVGDDGE